MKPVRIRYAKWKNEGIALLLALLFVVLLSAIVTDFMYKIHVEASLVSSSNSDHDAYLAAKTGVATAMSILHADRITNIEESGDVGGIYDGLDESWAQSSSVISFNDDVVNLTITDEYGKINLNALVFENSEGGEEEVRAALELVVRDVFMLYLGMEEDPTDLILDWLDGDENGREQGAESDYYESLDPPFSCKNGPMDSIEELLLLPGITPEIYFGLPSEEEQFENAGLPPEEGGRQLIPLFELFTVHGHPEGKININTTPIPGEIMTSISIAQDLPYMGIEETLQRLEENDPFVNDQELNAAPYILSAPVHQEGDPGNATNEVPLPPMFTTESNVFRILSDAQSNDSQVRIETYVFRDPSDNQNPEPQLFRVLDWRVIR